jgi:hypothetical protein
MDPICPDTGTALYVIRVNALELVGSQLAIFDHACRDIPNVLGVVPTRTVLVVTLRFGAKTVQAYPSLGQVLLLVFP